MSLTWLLLIVHVSTLVGDVQAAPAPTPTAAGRRWAAYDPYGAHATVGGSDTAVANANPYRYDAGQYDTKTGLYHFGQRYYNPGSGSWSQQDSIERLGDPAQGDRYAYAEGEPVDNTDLSGKGVFGCVDSLVGTTLSVGATIGGALLTPETGPLGLAIAGLGVAGIIAGGAAITDSCGQYGLG